MGSATDWCTPTDSAVGLDLPALHRLKHVIKPKFVQCPQQCLGRWLAQQAQGRVGHAGCTAAPVPYVQGQLFADTPQDAAWAQLDDNADALEHALMAALPLGPQSAAGGISLPESFHGELQV